LIGRKLSERFAARHARHGRRFHTLAEAAAAAEALGGLAHVLVEHDDARGCTRTRCLCRPSYVVRELTPEALREGEELERAWLREVAS
jgi:hypothetical protein